jgi:DNA-binding transcriptional LysR family regulator
MLHAKMLKYLSEVAHCGSIRKAAARLNVASSSINRQILALEDELGMPLFERLPRGLRPTAAGELLLGHVYDTLKQHERVCTMMRDLKGLRHGEASIAAVDGLATDFLPKIVTEFCHRRPKITVLIRSLALEDIVNAVAAGEIDLGLAFNIPPVRTLHTVASVECWLGAVVAPTHPLAGRTSVDLQECAAYPLVMGDTKMLVRQNMDAAFAEAGLQPEMIVETNSIGIMKRMTMLEEGLTFLNEMEVEGERRRKELVYLPLRNAQLMPQVLKVVHRAKGALDIVPNLMAEEFKTAFARLREPAHRP